MLQVKAGCVPSLVALPNAGDMALAVFWHIPNGCVRTISGGTEISFRLCLVTMDRALVRLTST
jgi:hypothetical protein